MLVCCLLTQNCQAGSVGGRNFFGSVQEKDYFRAKLFIDRSKKKRIKVIIMSGVKDE